MDQIVGVALALCAGIFTRAAGFERDRSLYPLVLIVIASYYVLFSVMGGETALGPEIATFAIFALIAVIGFRTNLWFIAVALIGHGLFDLHHGKLVDNAGTPTWWPMFCLSFDAAAGTYLAWRLRSGGIEATDAKSFANRIRPYVKMELAQASAAELGGDPFTAFRHLERAHVLGQRSAEHHVRVHMRMLMWAIRQNELHEMVGQIWRIVGAAAGTWIGLVPKGNTGGAAISGFQSMAIPEDLAGMIEAAR